MGLLPFVPFLPAAPAAAQGPQAGVGTGVIVEAYTFDDPDATGFEDISLLTLPFGASFEPTVDLEIALSGAWARGEMTLADGTALEISGLTDTSIRASYTVGRDVLVLSGAVFLPTGKVEHTAAEARVAGAVAYDLLPFRIASWGTGGGADASVALAAPLGSVSLGARVGYRLASEYEPFDDGGPAATAFVYDPGDQLYVRAALDADLERGSKLSLSATWQSFGEDTREGTNLFRTGDRLQAMASLVFPAAWSGSGWIYGGALHREEGAFLDPLLDGADPPPSQDVFFAGAGGRVLVGGWTVLPVADVRVLRTEDGLGQGLTAGAGVSLEIPLGDGPELVPTARARFGNVLVSEDVESRFTGYEVGVSLRGIGR